MKAKFEEQYSIRPYLEHYLYALGHEILQYQDRPVYRLDYEGHTCFLSGDDFLRRLCGKCVFSIQVPEESYNRVLDFLNLVNSRIGFSCFFLDTREGRICIRSEFLISGAEFVESTADELLTALNKDAYDFSEALQRFVEDKISAAQALEAVIQKQSSYDMFVMPDSSFPLLWQSDSKAQEEE